MQPIDALKEDFAQTLSFIDKCDSHIFTIKNWALFTSSAVIAFSISQHEDVIALANLALLFAFIYLELIYKSFQDTAIQHNADISARIDRYLAEPTAPDLLIGYSHSFGRKLQYPSVFRVFSLLGNRNRWHILNFYGLLAIFSVGAFVVARFVA
ncbi:MAG TPA: hypothetical protein VGO61_07800 [Steroidobacteraceae bacterium]|jgi:hypothetical protein|nr:hypothetical protein [Steroidobacteraceae bacterium]